MLVFMKGLPNQKGWNQYFEVVDSWIRNDGIYNKMEEGESLSDIVTRLMNVVNIIKNNILCNNESFNIPTMLNELIFALGNEYSN